MRKLYLDIDGVLLTTKHVAPANGVVSFIEFIISNFACYWLTTHCKGNKEKTLNYLSKYFDEAALDKMKAIKPTNWATLKTEAIDFSAEFYWLEDFPFQSELLVLESKQRKDNLIKVNLDKPNELKRIISLLSNSIS